MLEKVGEGSVRVKAYWVIAQPPYAYQGAVEPAFAVPPVVPGVTVFLPPDPLSSPVYIVVRRLDGRRIHVRIDQNPLVCISYRIISPGS